MTTSLSDQNSILPLISVISPVYHGEHTLEELTKQLVSTLTRIPCQFEIIYVEDASPDNSWQKIEAICEMEPRVRGLRLSRNFGQHAATVAGLEFAKGSHIVLIDCDLQDDPAYIPTLFAKIQSGYDIVYTYMKDRCHSSLRNACGRIFYKINHWLAGGNVDINAQTNNYIMITRQVLTEFLRIKEKNRHNLMILNWLGFKAGYVDIIHRERPIGKSSYTFSKLVNHAITGIISQSNRLLELSIGLGFLSCLFSFSGAIYLVSSYFMRHHLAGWTSVMVLMLLCTGVILISLGILGMYMGKIFDEVKNRPIYIVERIVN